MLHVQGAVGRRHHRQSLTLEVGVGHHGVDRGQGFLGSALGRALVPGRLPALLGARRAVVDLRFSRQLDREKGTGDADEVDQVGDVRGHLRGESGASMPGFCPMAAPRMRRAQLATALSSATSALARSSADGRASAAGGRLRSNRAMSRPAPSRMAAASHSGKALVAVETGRSSA